MKNLEISFRVYLEDTFEIEKMDKVGGHQLCKFLYSKILLLPDPALEETSYVKDGIPTKNGHEVITRALLNALNSNIQLAHQNKHMDSAEHLRYFIAEIEKLFVMLPHFKTDKF